MGIIGSTKKKILQEIQKNPLHGYGLAKKLGVSLSSVYEHLKDLKKHGLVEIREEKRKKLYHLTKKGELLLKALS